jgi:hypothetical protein
MYKSIDRLWPKAQPILVPRQNPARTRPKTIAHSPAQCVPRLSRRPTATSTLATILLSLVATHGQRNATDKTPETPANIIKAVAFLLEEATLAEYANKIVAQITKLTESTNSDPTSNDTMLHIEQAFKVINDTTKKQTETTEKTNTAIEKLQEQTVRTAQRTAILKTSCRDSLVNGNWQLASANPFTPLKAKLRD